MTVWTILNMLSFKLRYYEYFRAHLVLFFVYNFIEVDMYATKMQEHNNNRKEELNEKKN